MLRHPDNSNLHIHYDDFFEFLPVMVDKGPFVSEYLYSLKDTIELTIDQYPRVLAFRVDLRLPFGIILPEHAYTNEIISRFIASFKAKIEHNRDKARERSQYAHGSKVRYVWASVLLPLMPAVPPPVPPFPCRMQSNLIEQHRTKE